ncbi:MAG: hypothetical protein Q4A28_09155 [Brachymonas sp.]|nr:hypothetical protein [Brachymonas sp.]
MNKDLLIVSSAICASLLLPFFCTTPPYSETKNWPLPPIAKETINGVHNPLRIKEFVYRYGAYDKELMEADYFYGSCRAYLYSLLEPLPQGDIKLYLRQFDREKLESKRKSNKNTLLVVEDQSIYTTWMQLHEFKPSIFNPFDHNLKRQEELGQIINLENQEKYSFFLRCLDFIKDTTEPYKEKALVKRSGWDFYEEFKNKKTQAKYNQLTVISALNDPNTLISMMDSCSRSHVYYYNATRNIFFELTFNFGRIKNNPNRACR